MLGARRDDAGGRTFILLLLIHVANLPPARCVQTLMLNGTRLPRLSDRYHVEEIEAVRKGSILHVEWFP